MALPPALMKSVADALKTVLEPSAKRVSAGLLALVEAAMRGHAKSGEELLLDIVKGEIAREDRRQAAIDELRALASDPDMEHQRILARAAAAAVRGEFVMPALEIAGPILRDSEFERPSSPIWEMWKELLARACDNSRLDEAHPAYMQIIKQISGDEAKLLAAIAPWQAKWPPDPTYRPVIATKTLDMNFPHRLFFYLGHLFSLGLLEEPGTLDNGTDIVMVDDVHFRMLSTFGRGFMEAVTPPPAPAPP